VFRLGAFFGTAKIDSGGTVDRTPDSARRGERERHPRAPRLASIQSGINKLRRVVWF
jgi:hypothetical protein